jgi:hypothetical protein
MGTLTPIGNEEAWNHQKLAVNDDAYNPEKKRMLRHGTIKLLANEEGMKPDVVSLELYI